MFKIPPKPEPPAPIESCTPDVPLPDDAEFPAPTGDIEKDDRAEASTALDLLKKVDREAERVMGNGYWTCLVFPDEETCTAFLVQSGFAEFAECRGAYIDGLSAARKMGIELKPEPIRFKSKRSDRRLVEEVGVWNPNEEDQHR